MNNNNNVLVILNCKVECKAKCNIILIQCLESVPSKTFGLRTLVLQTG